MAGSPDLFNHLLALNMWKCQKCGEQIEDTFDSCWKCAGAAEVSSAAKAPEADDTFYARADAHIDLSNDQCRGERPGRVSASMMYATSRFNAWVSATGFRSGEELANAREETIQYFVNQYRLMLEENLDDYIQNFERNMK
jgi:hypothetical protein